MLNFNVGLVDFTSTKNLNEEVNFDHNQRTGLPLILF